MSWSSQKEKRGHLLYRLFCPKRIFLTFVFYLGVQYIEYTFRTYILSHIKKQYFAHFFLLVFKVVENLHCIVNYNVLNIFINFRQHLNGLENCNRIFFLHLPQSSRKHNQPFKMLSFKPNSHFGPSNLKSTSRKLNVLLIKCSFECSYHETIIRSYYISIHIYKKVDNSFFYSF